MREKTNKGITLITLVITIIVLLILASVTIATLTGENGVLNKANRTVEEYNYAQAEEKVKLAVLEYQTKREEETLYSVLNKIEGLEEINPNNDTEGPPYTIVVDGYIFEITDKLEIQREGKVTGIKPEIIRVEKGNTTSDHKKTEIIIETKTEDKEGLSRIILENNGIEIMAKEVEGKSITETFEITGNGVYKIKVVGKNGRKETSSEIIIDNLITISGTISRGTVIDGSVKFIVNAQTGQGTIEKVDLYRNNTFLKEIPIEETSNTIEVFCQIDDLPFCEIQNYYAQIISSTNENRKTNVVQVENRDSISTAEELRKLSTLVNNGNTFKGVVVSLRKDIDLEKKLFRPIGDDFLEEKKVFEGEFNGNYHTIKNLRVKDSMLGGLFGIIGENGSVKNLYINEAEITCLKDGNITNGILVATLYGKASRIGVSGMVETGNNSQESYMGGLCGWSWAGTIEECFSSAKIKVGASEVLVVAGGLTGTTTTGGNISDCYFDGEIIMKTPGTYANIGGLAGGCWNTGGTRFYNSYSVGTFLNTNNVSVGYVGELLGIWDSRTAGSNVNISNSFRLNNEFATFCVTNGVYPTSQCITEAYDFNCEATNLKGYSSRLGEKFMEDLDGMHNDNPILVWQFENK